MLVFILSAAAILFGPGPTNALLCIAGASRGIAASLRFIVGAALAYIVSISALRAGGGAVIEAVPYIGSVVRVMIAAYLVFLATQVWRAGTASGAGDDKPVTLRQIVIATLLNPKCFVFAFVIFPTHTSVPEELTYMALFTTIMAAATLSWAIVGATIGKATHGHGRKIFYRVAASALGVLAVFILASIL
jgi:threonine/homoserine/homoserine lactone efflux protein